MKRQFKNTIFSSLLASLILLASFGISLNMHFCHGDLAKLSLVSKQSCDEDLTSTTDYEILNNTVCDKSCCEDFTVKISTDDISEPFQSIDIQNLDFILVNTNINFLTQLKSFPKTTITKPYTSLLIDKNITVLFQKFII